jgi:ribonuclease D
MIYFSYFVIFYALMSSSLVKLYLMNIINTNKQLEEFCHPLLASKAPLAIGVDTEFIRERTYWPVLCLIQITSSLTDPQEAILIDPLADLDLSPFQALLASSHITKVIHSARQDIEIFCHEWDTLPITFFDTQVAAMVCGLGEGIGYSALVKSLFECDLEKDSQYTDWTRRPLTEKQLTYAKADVTHLLPAFDFLSKKLTELNRWRWMADDLEILLNPQTYSIEPQEAWLRIYSHRQKPQNLALLRDICAWREVNATRLNVNRGRLLKNEQILKISLTPAKNLEEFQEISGSNNLTPILAEELFAVYKAALQKPKTSWPEAPKAHVLPISKRDRLSTLRSKLNKVAQDLNVPARLIAPKQDLMALAEGNLKDNRIMTGWRYEVFGHIVEELLPGVD